MTIASKLRSLIRNLFRRARLEQDLDDEVRSYARMLADEGRDRGLNALEARRRALIELGGLEQVKEQVREVRMGARLEMVWQDLRYGARMLRKNPGFSAVAALTLALGIGANAAIFTLTYAVILKSLPVPNPGQLVRYTFRESGLSDLSISGPAYDALRKHETVNQDLLAWSNADLAVDENGTVTRASGALISGNGFRVLELRPYLGRVFGDADDVTEGGPGGYQALLGYDYWKRHFQQNPGVVGHPLNVNGRAVTVIGVLPEGFYGLIAGVPTDILLPLSFEEVTNAPHPMRHMAGSFWLTVVGRLKPGESLAGAQANLRATDAVVREEADPSHTFLRGFFAPFKLGVESGRGGRSFLKVDYARPLLVLEILVALLLLLCCANTALLMVARTTGRFREFAVRSALGAQRGRLFGQVLGEVGLLAARGLVIGLWLGWAAARSLVAMLAGVGEPPPALDIGPRLAILAFAAAVTILSALAAGLWPALRASRAAPALDLKQGEALSSSQRLGSWIVPVQVAISITLLAAASLLGSALVHLLLEHTGFRSDGLVMADVDLSAAKPTDKQAAEDAWQMLRVVENAPGVQAAALLQAPPLHNGWSAGHFFSVAGHGTVHSDMQTWPETVSPDYFGTMGTQILEGRGFAKRDRSESPICVLSASAAAYFFPNEEPVGQFVYSGGADPSKDGAHLDPKDACRVIGIAEDVHFQSLREAPPRMLYSLASADDGGTQFSLGVRSSGAGLGAAALRNAARQVVPLAPAPTIYTFKELVNAHLQQERMLTALSACFAAIALLLTALGLYGLLARTVLLRTREIGLRLALGAPRRDALLLVVREGMRLVLIGAGIGIGVALVVTRLLRSLLFGVRPTDPVALAGVVGVVVAIALLASFIPARRATRLNPTEALRCE
jgi:predicted permease